MDTYVFHSYQCQHPHLLALELLSSYYIAAEKPRMVFIITCMYIVQDKQTFQCSERWLVLCDASRVAQLTCLNVVQYSVQLKRGRATSTPFVTWA